MKKTKPVAGATASGLKGIAFNDDAFDKQILSQPVDSTQIRGDLFNFIGELPKSNHE